MSDTNLMFRLYGRLLVPLLAAYTVFTIVSVVLRSHAQGEMVMSIVTMLTVVGASLYALDSPFRFYVLGDDRLLHLSPTSRARTSLRVCGVLTVYLMGFFLIAQMGELWAMKARPSQWLGELATGGVQKLVSLASGFTLLLLLCALVKGLHGRLVLRVLAWSVFCLTVSAQAGTLVWWLSQPPHQVEWMIGTASSQMTSIYTGLIPVLVRADADLSSIRWLWCVINLTVSSLAVVGFLTLHHFRKLNFLTE